MATYGSLDCADLVNAAFGMQVLFGRFNALDSQAQAGMGDVI